MNKNSLRIKETNQSDLFSYRVIKLIKKFSQILLCLFIFFLEVTQAQDSHTHSITSESCDPKEGLIPQEFTDIMETLSNQRLYPLEKGFILTSEEDVFNAPCRKEAPSLEEMEDWLIEWAGTDTKINERTHGVSFVEENPKMLNLFKMLNDWSFHYRHLLTFNSTLQSIRNCQKVICAMKKFYGEKEGVQLLYMLAKYGLNGSPLAPVNKDRSRYSYWSSDELDKSLAALSSFPKDILPFRKNIGFIRYKRGTMDCEKGMAAASNDFVWIFDCGIGKSHYIYEYIVVHEVAHIIGEKGLHDSPEWLSFADWEEIRTPSGLFSFSSSYKPHNRKCLVSPYGGENPMEDFAESVTAYRYNPERMKEKCPQKYDYLKENVFNGWEYINNRCFKSEWPNSF